MLSPARLHGFMRFWTQPVNYRETMDATCIARASKPTFLSLPWPGCMNIPLRLIFFAFWLNSGKPRSLRCFFHPFFLNDSKAMTADGLVEVINARGPTLSVCHGFQTFLTWTCFDVTILLALLLVSAFFFWTACWMFCVGVHGAYYGVDQSSYRIQSKAILWGRALDIPWPVWQWASEPPTAITSLQLKMLCCRSQQYWL